MTVLVYEKKKKRMSTRAEHPEIVNSNKQIFTKPFIFIARSREILVFENKKKKLQTGLA